MLYNKIMVESFEKESLTADEQLNLLISRGLLVNDYNSAVKILSRIGYYHLSSYMRNFQYGEEHKFCKNTEFQELFDLYNFDRQLRHITFNAIEKIEIAYRAAISNIMCKKYGSHWFYNIEAFENEEKQEIFIELIKHEIEKRPKKKNDSLIETDENIKRYAETFIAKYYEKYSSPDLPPFWMTVETFSMGSLNRLYRALKDEYKREVIKYLGFKEDATFIALYSNWLQWLCIVRNFCAHHSRLYNRIFKIKAKQHKKIQEFANACNNRFYYVAMIINYYLLKISNDSSFEDELIKLFSKYSNIDKTKLGFPEGWECFTITPITRNAKVLK